MQNASKTLQLTAANDNPGGPQTAEVAMSYFVTLLARAYVAKARASERSA